MSLLDKVLSKNNIEEAYKRVYQNKGANGVDGVTDLETIWMNISKKSKRRLKLENINLVQSEESIYQRIMETKEDLEYQQS